jgi:hypothetical protein
MDFTTPSERKRIEITKFGQISVLFGLFFIGALITFGLMAICGIGSQARGELLASAVIQDACMFIMPAVVAIAIMYKNPLSYLGITTSDKHLTIRPFLGVLIVFIIGMPCMNWLIEWNNNLSLPAFASGLEQSMRQMEDNAQAVTAILLNDTSITGLITGVLIVGVLAALSEELFFRGALQKIFTINSAWKAIWMSAFVFSFMHFQFFGFIPRLIMGVFFGYLFYWTGSLWVPIIAHAFNNSVTVFVSWLSYNHYISESSPISTIGDTASGYSYLAAISLVALILFFIYARKYFFSNGTNISTHISTNISRH